MPKVTMPQLGESVAEGTIGRWLKQVGDHVDKYEPIVEVITDKVNAEVPSPFEGTLTAILVQEGETVPNNAEIAVIDGAGEAVAAPLAPAAAAPAPLVPAPPPAAPRSPPSPSSRAASRPPCAGWPASMASTFRSWPVPGTPVVSPARTCSPTSSAGVPGRPSPPRRPGRARRPLRCPLPPRSPPPATSRSRGPRRET